MLRLSSPGFRPRCYTKSAAAMKRRDRRRFPALKLAVSFASTVWRPEIPIRATTGVFGAYLQFSRDPPPTLPGKQGCQATILPSQQAACAGGWELESRPALPAACPNPAPEPEGGSRGLPSLARPPGRVLSPWARGFREGACPAAF